MLWLDTSALVSLYVPEARSARVARLVRRVGEAIPFSQLHELELANALRLRVFRREAKRQQVDATRARIAEDLDAGILHRVAVDWPRRSRERSSWQTRTPRASVAARSICSTWRLRCSRPAIVSSPQTAVRISSRAVPAC